MTQRQDCARKGWRSWRGEGCRPQGRPNPGWSQRENREIGGCLPGAATTGRHGNNGSLDRKPTGDRGTRQGAVAWVHRRAGARGL